MPFKDAANHRDDVVGWSPERAMKLGESALQSVLVSLDSLRGELELPEPELPPEVGGDDGDRGPDEGEEPES